MKKLLFLIGIFCVLKASAQTYSISFAGAGLSTTVNTVKVENLTASTFLTLNGGDVLRLTSTTGVNSIENKQSSELKIYPNPMTGNSILQIYPPKAGKVVITVLDMTGKLVAQIQSYLENCLQEFHLSGINSGLYLISIKGNTFQYSGKLLCNAKSTGTISIEKISNIQAVDEKISKDNFKGVQATVDMAYNTGDRLKFTGISGIYSTIITDIPVSDKTITFNFIACTDGDNNNYPVVTINTQVWMAENLKTTRYLNSDLIGTTTPATKDISGESTPKYQWAYAGDEGNVSTFGRLYTWHAITDSRNVCPTGWHVPTDAEWTTLATTLGGESVAGGKLKETGTIHWQNPNSGATNDSGFTAFPSGMRGDSGGFDLLGSYGLWWSSTLNPNYSSIVWIRYLGYDDFIMHRADYASWWGYSVRCIRD